MLLKARSADIVGFSRQFCNRAKLMLYSRKSCNPTDKQNTLTECESMKVVLYKSEETVASELLAPAGDSAFYALHQLQRK